MPDRFSRLAARLSPRMGRLGRRIGQGIAEGIEHQLAPAARLARHDLVLVRTWARHADALRRELGEAEARAYTELVVEVADRDPALARVVAHGLADHLAGVDPGQRGRYMRLLRAVARDRIEALPLVIRTLPALLLRLDDLSLSRYLARGLDLHAESARKAESFLRVESGEGQREAGRLQRGLSLESVRRTLSLYARAHCGRDVQVRAGPALQAGGVSAFTDGRHLYLPDAIEIFGDERDFLVYRVLTARSAGYIEFGSLDLDLSRLPGDWAERQAGEIEIERLVRSFSNPSLARDLFRVLEELRIEGRVRAAYPGIRRDMDALAEAWRPPRPEIADLAPAEQAVEHLARRALGLPAPRLPDERARQAALAAEATLDRVRAPEATVEDTVLAVQTCYPLLHALLRQVDPDALQRLDEQAGEDRGGRGGSGERNDTAERGEPGPSQRREAEPELSYTPLPDESFASDLRPEQLSASDRQLEERALDLLDALRQAEPGVPTSLSELRDRLGREGRSYEEMAGFLDRLEAPKGPVYEGRSDQDGVMSADPSTGDALSEEASGGGRQFLYPEWDSTIEDHKPAWVRVTEYVLEPGSPDFAERVRREHGPLVNEVRRAFEALRPEAIRRVRGLADGDEIDLDRAIQARIERKAGGSPDHRVYLRHERSERDVAVAFLVDMSSSTNEVVGADSKRVLDVEKEALVLIAEAVHAIGDACAIYGFSGYGRDQVAFYIAKDFSDPWGDRVRERIGRMSWKMENRDGAAIRHATARLQGVGGRVKLLLLLSDGKPLDCGCDHYADRYAQDDTRMALQEARAGGIHPFCITIDPGGPDYLAELYGETGYTVIDRVESLPRRLPQIYRRLTR